MTGRALLYAHHWFGLSKDGRRIVTKRLEQETAAQKILGLGAPRGGGGGSKAKAPVPKAAALFGPGASLPPGRRAAGNVNQSAVETVGKYQGMLYAAASAATRLQRCWRLGVVPRMLRKWARQERSALRIQRVCRGWVCACVCVCV